MKSKRLIYEQARRKSNPELVETIFATRKNEDWRKVANVLAYPRRKRVAINLDRIDKESKEGDTILIPGKVLGEGNINKKIVVIALSFSEEAKKKLKEKKCETLKILEEMKKNKNMQGVKILM